MTTLDAIIRLLGLIPQWPAVTYPMAGLIIVSVAAAARRYQRR